MNQVVFDQLMRCWQGRALNEKTVKALNACYVAKKSRKEAMSETGCELSTLSKAIERFEMHIDSFLNEKGMVRKEYFLHKEIAVLLDAIEEVGLTGKSALKEKIAQLIIDESKSGQRR